jgi:hypothetical protein
MSLNCLHSAGSARVTTHLRSAGSARVTTHLRSAGCAWVTNHLRSCDRAEVAAHLRPRLSVQLIVTAMEYQADLVCARAMRTNAVVWQTFCAHVQCGQMLLSHNATLAQPAGWVDCADGCCARWQGQSGELTDQGQRELHE